MKQTNIYKNNKVILSLLLKIKYVSRDLQTSGSTN